MIVVGDMLLIGEGIIIVMGGVIMVSLVIFDLMCYFKNDKYVLGVIFIGIIVGKCMVNGLVILIVKILGMVDVVSIMF